MRRELPETARAASEAKTAQRPRGGGDGDRAPCRPKAERRGYRQARSSQGPKAGTKGRRARVRATRRRPFPWRAQPMERSNSCSPPRRKQGLNGGTVSGSDSTNPRVKRRATNGHCHPERRAFPERRPRLSAGVNRWVTAHSCQAGQARPPENGAIAHPRGSSSARTSPGRRHCLRSSPLVRAGCHLAASAPRPPATTRVLPQQRQHNPPMAIPATREDR
jgi:hypothetical protein